MFVAYARVDENYDIVISHKENEPFKVICRKNFEPLDVQEFVNEDEAHQCFEELEKLYCVSEEELEF